MGLDLYYPTHAAIVLRRGWGTQVLRDCWKKQSQVLRLPLVAQDDRQKEDDVRARKCFPTLESKDDSRMGHPDSSLLLDAEQGAAMCGEFYVERLRGGDVLLVPDVVDSVWAVLQMKDHPGQVG